MRARLVTTCAAIALLAGLTFTPTVGAVSLLSPDPGGDPNAAVPLPPPAGKYFGFNDDAAHSLHGLVPTDYVELSRTAGGNLIRASLDWRDAEPVRDQWHASSWARWQGLYDRALERGVTPLFTIGFAPPWARDPASCSGQYCRVPPTPQMDGEWAEFAAEVARRFPAALIEVWNEPNLTNFWTSGADPRRYAELLDTAHDAIKSVSPQTMVLGGGLSNVQVSLDGHMALREYLDAAYSASPSIAANMDALSFHPYVGVLGLGAGTLFAKSFHDVRTVREAHGDSATPLFVTEVGVSTGFPELRTETDQAETMMALYRRTMTMDDVVGVVFHRLIEPADTTGNLWELGAAFTRYGDSPPRPREAYCRFVDEANRSYPRCAESAARPTRIDLEPGAVSDGSALRVSFESPNFGAAHECALDDAAFEPCWSPLTYDGLAEGEHTVAIRTHSEGNAPTVDSRSFTVDRSAPESLISSGPRRFTREATVRLSLDASEPGASMACRLDLGTWQPCTRTPSFGPLSEGATHTVAVRATDVAGNTDPTPATRGFTVDLTPPEQPQALEPADGATTSPRPVFSWEPSSDAVSRVARYLVRLDRVRVGTATAATTSFEPAADLTAGLHRLQIVAVDAAGNKRLSPVSRFRVADAP